MLTPTREGIRNKIQKTHQMIGTKMLQRPLVVAGFSQCQSSSGSVGKSIRLKFRRLGFKSWLDFFPSISAKKKKPKCTNCEEHSMCFVLSARKPTLNSNSKYMLVCLTTCEYGIHLEGSSTLIKIQYIHVTLPL